MPSGGTWLSGPTTGHRLAAQLSMPESPRGTGVVIVAPAGYEYSASYRMLWALAEEYRSHGCVVVRVDPFGTGDSEGDARTVVSLDAWREAYAAGCLAVRRNGATQIVLVGIRLSASIALTQAVVLDADAVVAIAPVASGRRYVQELTLVGLPLPGRARGISVGGYAFTGGLLDEISPLDLGIVHLDDVPVLIVEDLSGPPPGVRRRLAEMDAELETRGEHVDDFLAGPAEEAEVDPGSVTRLVSWTMSNVAAAHPSGPSSPDGAQSAGSALLVDQDPEVVERFVSLGPDRLSGVLTRLPRTSPRELLVFLNSGSDPRTGPGRAWVEFARALSTPRRAALRVDFRGWGESPDGPDGPGRPYDSHAVDDLARLIPALRQEGWHTITLAGLCAGAWIALQVAREGTVDGVVALNPQLYWEPGDPVEALMETTRDRRIEEIAWIKQEAARGRWDAEDERGLRPPAAEWLDALHRSPTRVSLVFAEGDDGIEYLRDRLGRRLAEVTGPQGIHVIEVPEIDHAMHQVWLRPRMTAVFAAELDQTQQARCVGS